MKEEGNKIFKEAKYPEAIFQYEKAMMGLGFKKTEMDDFPDRQAKVKKELQAPLINNVAMCEMKQDHFDKAGKLLSMVLQLDP
jgi:hypothetical protein